jgi:hypothetical protein
VDADGNDAVNSMDIVVKSRSPHWHTRTCAVQCLGRKPGSKDVCILLCSHQHRGSGESRFFRLWTTPGLPSYQPSAMPSYSLDTLLPCPYIVCSPINFLLRSRQTDC